MESGKLHLMKFHRRWQILSYAEAVLYAIGIAILFYLASKNLWLGVLSFVVAVVAVLFIQKPWKHNLATTGTYVDAHVDEASFSTGLLLQPEDSLSNLAKLQRYKVSEELSKRLGAIHPPNKLKQALMVTLGLVLLGIVVQQLDLFKSVESVLGNATNETQIQFIATDSISEKSIIPKISSQDISVTYPSYTRKGTIAVSDPNIKTIAGATVQWLLVFDNSVTEVYLDRMGELIPLQKGENGYRIKQVLLESGFYSFKFKNEDGIEFTSDLFSLEAIPDNPPEIEILGLEQYTYFDFSDKKVVQLQSAITDDYGIDEAYIIATVSKGSGESVKFREEKLNFKETISKGVKSVRATKTLI